MRETKAIYDISYSYMMPASVQLSHWLTRLGQWLTEQLQVQIIGVLTRSDTVAQLRKSNIYHGLC